MINPFGDSATYHHIGLVVKSIDSLKIPDLNTYMDFRQKARVGFINMMGCQIELVEPIDESSPVCNSLRKNSHLHHICYEVEDLEAAIKLAEKNSFKRISAPVPAKAFENREISWIYHPIWGLYELLEEYQKGDKNE